MNKLQRMVIDDAKELSLRVTQRLQVARETTPPHTCGAITPAHCSICYHSARLEEIQKDASRIADKLTAVLESNV